jgi:hypothetical protein
MKCLTSGVMALTAKGAGLVCLACDDSLIETRLQVHAKSRSLESMRLCRQGEPPSRCIRLLT